MAVLGSSVATIVDIAKRLDPDGKIARIAELLNQENEILDDIVWAEGKGRIVRDVSTGEVLEFVVVWRDVSERKLLEDKLSALAMTDGLTGLANRRAFDEASC